MASRHRPVSPRARAGSRLAYPLMLVGVLCLGVMAFTIINGELRLPFGGGVLFAFENDDQQKNADGLPEGTVGVYGCPRTLPAFTKLTREHLLTADGLYKVPVVEEAIEPNGLFPFDNEGLQRLLGRVLRRNKPKNFAFTESDFLPVGTRPGPSAGIPPGKRGIWLDLAKVQGLADVRAGDYVDLVAAAKVKAPSPADPNMLGNLIDPVLRARMQRMMAKQGQRADDTKSWVIAHSAFVIQPMRVREPASNRSASKKDPKFIEEVFVAMDPDEVGQFSRAVAENVSIVAAPRSGQPEDHPTMIEDVMPADTTAELRRILLGEDDRERALGMVEVIRGDTRETVTVPRGPTEREGR